MILQLTENDFQQWKVLRLEAVKLNPESFGESFENVQKQDEAWFHDSLKRGTMFAYETDGEMVGLVGTFPMQPGNLKHRAVLFGLYVKPEYRSKGIASTLVEHVIGYVKPTHEQIHLTVATNNEAATALYKKHGFIVYGTEPDALKIGNDYYDEYLMLKKL
ncbi:MAG: GNAT family N-acetyltransferase [Alphaproteobacteria bacterium]|nr:GNAT family N-acetyltransferase [Alphaproteobacteria bacterium]